MILSYYVYMYGDIYYIIDISYNRLVSTEANSWCSGLRVTCRTMHKMAVHPQKPLLESTPPLGRCDRVCGVCPRSFVTSACKIKGQG